jgi:hypothetical protein
MKNSLVGALAATGLALALASPANAVGQYITQLEYSQDGHITPPLGTVTVTDGAGYVDVLVEFGSLIQNIVDTGAHVSFAFNLVNALGNPIDPLTFTVLQPVGGGGYVYGNVAGGDYDQNPFKNFTNAVISTAGTGGNHQVPPPLEFRLTSPGISFLGAAGPHFTSTVGGGTVAGFEGGWWFAADIQTVAGTPGFQSQTFTVAGRDFCTVGVNCIGVPEPATWAMMLVGFGGMGALLRRNRRYLRTALA